MMYCIHQKGRSAPHKILPKISASAHKRAAGGGTAYRLLSVLFSGRAFLRLLSFGCGIFLMLFGLPDARSQSPEKQEAVSGGEIRPLRVGEKVPEEFWTREHLFYIDGDTVRKNLEEYKGKLLVLDFWATWCKSCIEGFPKLDLLKERFGTNVNFILVNSRQTRDNFDGIERFLSGYQKRNNYTIHHPNIILDSILYKIFPHRSIPHFVWIDPSKKYHVATHPNEVNFENIQNILTNNKNKIHEKKEIEPGNHKAVEVFQDTTEIMISSLLLPYKEGFAYDLGNIYAISCFSIYRVVNQSLRYLSQLVFNNELHNITQTHYVYDKDLSTETMRLLIEPGQYDAFCYELINKGALTIEEAEERLKKDLQLYFNLTVERKFEQTDVYIVRTNGNIYKSKTKGEIRENQLNRKLGKLYMKNISLNGFLHYVSNYLSHPLILEDIPRMNIDIDFPDLFSAMKESEIIFFLEKNGLSISKVTRKIEFAHFKPYRI